MLYQKQVYFLIILAEYHLAPFLTFNLEEIDLWMEGKQEENAIFPYGTFAFLHFFRAAFLEEGLKFALLIFICVKLEALDEPIDAIVYGAAIGLGYEFPVPVGEVFCCSCCVNCS